MRHFRCCKRNHRHNGPTILLGLERCSAWQTPMVILNLWMRKHGFEISNA